MDLLAEINRGVPPIGLGAFMRAQYVDGPWEWVAIVGNNANYHDVVNHARAAGKKIWLYSMPGSFAPTVWRDGLSTLIARASEVSAEGIIVDPETGWDGHWDQIAAFGAALQDASTVTRVGITSYPAWAGMPALANAGGDACFGIPQLYGQQGAFSQGEIDGQWARWRSSFGTRLIPGFALWIPEDHPELRDPAVYAAYLTRLPRAGGSIGWTTGAIPVHMLQAMRGYSPGGNMLFTIGLGTLAWIGRPAGAITIGIGIALLVMVILFAREVRHA